MRLLRKCKIFVAGHNGMVGNALLRYFESKGIKDVIFVSKKDKNLLTFKEFKKKFKGI